MKSSVTSTNAAIAGASPLNVKTVSMGGQFFWRRSQLVCRTDKFPKIVSALAEMLLGVSSDSPAVVNVPSLISAIRFSAGSPS
ncbi:MAG: hypothetical protein CMH56_10015 [Myxococcales bacterium]|nr:hypothetical protein [Myxococcales bacterium]